MSTPRDIVVIVGSLRKESLNRKTAKALIEIAPAGLKLEIVEIGALPLYNEDLEHDPPREWTTFRERVRRADGVIFVTPEYNRSVPGAAQERDRCRLAPVRQEAPGRASRAASSAFRPARSAALARTIICASRWCSSMCRRCSSPKPISAAPASCSTKRASYVNESTREFLGKFLQAYAAWVEKLAPWPRMTPDITHDARASLRDARRGEHCALDYELDGDDDDDHARRRARSGQPSRHRRRADGGGARHARERAGACAAMPVCGAITSRNIRNGPNCS